MRIGYARVSTLDQSLSLQEDALRAAGCGKIFTDVASGARTDRPGLEDLLNYVRPGDMLVVWKLDRLGRSLPHLIETVNDLNKRGVGLRSLKEKIETESAAGRMFFNIMAVLAQFERELIQERTKAGLASARARGRMGGRKPILTDSKLAQAKTLLNGGTKFIEVCRTLQCSPRTLRRRLTEASSPMHSYRDPRATANLPQRHESNHQLKSLEENQ